MEQEKFIVLENRNGTKYALIQEKEKSLDEKVIKIEKLLHLMMKQSIQETIKEYHRYMKEELREQDEKIEALFRESKEREEKHWEGMEEHFQKIDRAIREKQLEGKRKKHSIF